MQHLQQVKLCLCVIFVLHGSPCGQAGVPLERRAAELRKAERTELLRVLTAFELPVAGHEGLAKAEVTGGGIHLSELDMRTLESRVLPHVHCCGEIVDVFGRIGGFNFFWAWTSGRAAGLAAAGLEPTRTTVV